MEKEKYLKNEKETNLNQEKIENENSVEKLAEQVETIKNNYTQDEEYDDEEEISVHDIEENEYLADDYDIDDEITEDDEFSIKNNEYLADDYDINNEIAEDDEENQEDAKIESNEYLNDEEYDFLNEDDRYLLNRYTDSDDNSDGDTFESLIQEVQNTLDNISVTGKKHKHSMYTLPIKEEFPEVPIEKEETNPVKEEVKNYTEDIEKPLGGVYSVDEEKPFTGSFTLKEQPENNNTVEIIEEEKDVDVPVGGSFDVEPADVTVSGTFTQKRKKKEIVYPQSPILTLDDPDEEFVSNPDLYADDFENNVTDPDDEVTFVAVDNGIELESDYVEENNFIDVLEIDEDDTERVVSEKSVEVIEEAAVSDESVGKENQVEIINQVSKDIIKTDVEKLNSVVEDSAEKQTNKTLTDTYKKEDLKETIQEAGMVSDVETLSEEVNIEEIKATDVPSKEVEVVSAAAVSEPVSKEVENVPVIEKVTEETTEPISEEEVKTSATEKADIVEDNNVIIDEETNEEIDIEKEYSLDEEKPLTGSFKLKEQLESIIEKDVETLDVPLSGSFGVEPAEVTVSGSYNSNDEKSANAEPKPAEEVVATVAAVSEPVSKEVDNVPVIEEVTEKTEPISEEEVKTSATEKADIVEDNNVIIDEETNEEIDIEKEYSLDEEKPLTGSFKLKEQLESIIEKDVETLDVPLSGSFGVEPAEVTVSGSYNSSDEKSANAEPKPAEEVVATVAAVLESVSKEAENVPVIEEVTEPISEEEIKTPATEDAETVADNNAIIDEETNEEIDIEKEYSLDEEKPLTGSFKLKEQLESIIEKDVETLDVPLSGSFGVEPAEVTVSGSYNSSDEKSANAESKPAEEVVATVAAVSEPVSKEVENVPVIEEVTEKTEPISEEEIKTPATEDAETVADNNAIIDKEANEEIDIEKEYSLDEEKPLTGSFKLKEQLEVLIEKDVETLDVPLSGSFGVEPAEVTVSGSYNSSDEKSVNTEPKSAEEVVATVAVVSEPVSKEVENVPVIEEVTEKTEPISEEEIKTPATEDAETVADNNAIIDKEANEEIDIEKEYSLDEEKPLTGSFKLKEQLENIIEKNIEALDVPLLGSFGLDPAEVTVSGKYETRDSKVNNTDDEETISFVEGEKYDIDSIMDAIIRAAHSNGNHSVSPTKFAEQVRNILEKN